MTRNPDKVSYDSYIASSEAKVNEWTWIPADWSKVAKPIEQAKNPENSDLNNQDRVVYKPKVDYSEVQKKVAFVQNAEEKDPKARPISQKWPEAIAQNNLETEWRLSLC